MRKEGPEDGTSLDGEIRDVLDGYTSTCRTGTRNGQVGLVWSGIPARAG